MTENQTRTLMKMFQDNPYLNKEEKRQLAKSLNVSELQIRDWYINRRKKRRHEASLNGTGEESSTKYAISVTYIYYMDYACVYMGLYIQDIKHSTHTHTRTYARTHIHTNTHTLTSMDASLHYGVGHCARF